MQITTENIIEDFGGVARASLAEHGDQPQPADPVQKQWLEVCRALVSILDTMPAQLPWGNFVQILDMQRRFTPDVWSQMVANNHPFCAAWQDAQQKAEEE